MTETAMTETEGPVPRTIRRRRTPTGRPSPTHRGGSASGFTLPELLVALVISLFVLLAILLVLDVTGEMSRTEVEKAQLQQSLRGAQRHVGRLVRMAGRGGLRTVPVPGRPVSRTPAVEVLNGAAANQDLIPGLAGSPKVAEGTDVLILRGVFDAPLYQVNAADPAVYALSPDPADPSSATGGTVVLNDPGPAGVPQDLSALEALIDAAIPAPLVLTSAVDPDLYAVVELDPANSNADASPATVTFKVTGGTHTTAYRSLFEAPANGLTDPMRTISGVGVLEEYRFYLRQPEQPGDPVRLSRAQMIPGTQTPWGADAAERAANLRVDIADDLVDLQIALGFDSHLAGGFFNQDTNQVGNDDRVVETDDGQADDWLFNAPQDDVTASPWSPAWTAATPRPELQFVRLTFLGRGERVERDHVAPALEAIEDRVYGESPTPADEANRVERLFRRALLTGTVEMRNQ